MANVSGGSSFSVAFNQTPNFPFTNPVAFSEAYGAQYQISGTGADKCNLFYIARLTFVASTPQTLDVTTLLDPFGAALNFARFHHMAYRVNSLTDGDTLLVGGATTNEFTGATIAASKFKVMASSAGNPSGGWVILSAPNTTGYPVSPTSKNIKLDPGASAFTADLVYAGCDV